MRFRVSANRISEIVCERHRATAGAALRLARYFNIDPCCWLKAQVARDLAIAESEDVGDAVEALIVGAVRRVGHQAETEG